MRRKSRFIHPDMRVAFLLLLTERPDVIKPHIAHLGEVTGSFYTNTNSFFFLSQPAKTV